MRAAISIAILALSVALPGGPTSCSRVPVELATVESIPGQLEVEEGFVAVRPNWYQDVFGLLFDYKDEYGHLFTLESSWEKANVLLVTIRTRRESGTHPNLHLEISDGHVKRCWVDGRWHGDAGAEPSDFDGEMRNVSGLARVRLQSSKLSCIFTIRGDLWGNPAREKGDRFERVMGGFEVTLPARER